MRGHSARGRKHTEFVVLARVSDTDCRGWKRPEKPTEIAPQLARFHTVRYELSLYRPVAQFSKLDPCDDPSRICRGLKQRLEKKQKQSLSGKSRVMMWRWPGLGNGALEFGGQCFRQREAVAVIPSMCLLRNMQTMARRA